MEISKGLHHDLVSATRRILKLGPTELRVTDAGLICKNPNYSVCDAMLKTDTVYCVEYLLSYWESRTDHVPCFIFKNTGCAVSLCCFVRAPLKLVSSRHVGEFNVLKVNDSLIVTLKDIEEIKPSAYGVLTKCVVRKSNSPSVFNIELIAFGPENEAEYENLLKELCAKKAAANGAVIRSRLAALRHHHSNSNSRKRLHSPRMTIAPPPFPPPTPPPPPPGGFYGICRCRTAGPSCCSGGRGSGQEEEPRISAAQGVRSLAHMRWASSFRVDLRYLTIGVVMGVLLFLIYRYVS
ncbi:membrane protein UL50 [Cynomolgus macaque cytomegalovirus strain Ottawa]|uniref:Membrane protein UL50 n=2 Tax=Cytomegalovirus TaxID=10358 RepID=G8H185_9BETA|nr:membrane protein UL50 [Cynomolgus macaque cytomegalovirus strain Ottawa]YP_009337500.1 Cy81 [Cynomolgus cytomegalovirus]AKT72717.1 protein UL50 [Cynomolgus macaque cytomegalovirus strain Mauritius]AXG21776.1 protein UL50 [synthetic construct]AEQ32159.1 membrane protein UL50 [Cynomolgus macaque cytomegalovirus strain Ottawa]APT39339.1 Cy81 [Cynomolgus cytomegalovirus]APT39452.1 Cy81 [Cynomolgus cytomegalovirus]